MAHWTMDLRDYARRKNVEIRDVRKAYAFALYSSIVRKTPVDTGRARGNWQVTAGSPAGGEVEDRMKTPRGMDSVPDVNGDESIFITNNLPYITALEYGGYSDPVEKGTYNKRTKSYEVRSDGGYSKQAPHGMVGVTLANNENIFNAAVRAVRRSG